MDSGTIIIDNIDISKIGLKDLRRSLSVIPQDPFLFAGTVRSNIDPFNKYTDIEIWDSLKRVKLAEFINHMTLKLEASVEEDGQNLSVGQRQLLCLGRALLRKSKILIMDEATASIDHETDQIIQATIREEFRESTVLTIAHRLNTVLDSNKILVLSGGKIAEFDTPEVLLSDTNSLFYALVNGHK